MKCFVCQKTLYSDVFAKACRLCGMALPRSLKKEFCCAKCENIFKEIHKKCKR
jgi:hypothetical protein